MKRYILFFFLTTFGLSVCTSQTHAQVIRRSCPSGACPTSVRIVQTQRVYSAYRYAPAQKAVAPCGEVQVVQPCEPVAETAETTEPCAPVAEMVEPCAPVAETCEQNEYVPTEQGVCVNGTCPIRTAAKVAAKTAHAAVRKVAKTASWLAAVNRTRAKYGLAPLQGDATLDAGCAEATNYCASVGGLAHTAGNEILAYNQTGIDAAIQSWLESPAHRAYLLSPNFKVAGISVVRDKHGRVWCAMRFR